MATYYVRQDGSDANTGLGSTTALAWRTLQKALGATGIGSGDIVYIAPGHYNELVTVGGTYSAETQIIGDPTALQFSGVNAGYVKHSQFSSTGTAARTIAGLISATSKNYLHFKNIYFEMSSDNATISPIYLQPSRFTSFTGCVFYNNTKPSATTLDDFRVGVTTGTDTTNINITKCIFYGLKYGIMVGNNATGDNSSLTDSVFIASESMSIAKLTVNIYNCSFYSCVSAMRIFTGTVVNMYNCLFNQCTTAVTNAGTLTENFNRFIGNTANVSNSGTYSAGGSSTAVGITGVEAGYSLLHNLTNAVMFGSVLGSQNASFGTSSGAPATDLFGVTWTGTSPDAGAVTFRSIGAVGQYLPTERNASAITIAPASTSQSIELYLGATGLTFSTTGLAAYYVRNQSAPVAITLVTQTPTGAWSSGGFAEISSSLVPGVYRLDVPNAAFAAGASDVTIVVRGASGTNGAALTVTLSSGGLTSAQTAAAVWGELTSGYNTGLDFGGVINEIRNVVGATESYVLDVPNQVWDELKADHTIPNSFGDYLDTKVSTGSEASRIQLRQGPFLIKQNAIDSVITEVNQFLSTVPNIEMVLIDSSGGSVSVAGATLVMRVRNQAGTAVVNNVTPTVAYADGGVIRWSPNQSWTALGVTTAGTYRIVVERTMSGVTTTFGPFLVQLSSG